MFIERHLGPNEEEIKKMLEKIGVNSISQLLEETIPKGIRLKNPLQLPLMASGTPAPLFQEICTPFFPYFLFASDINPSKTLYTSLGLLLKPEDMALL